MARKYHCVVDNPPYMGGGNMNKELGDFVKTNYPAGKADLMACFMEAGLEQLCAKGFLGMINQHSWMFLSSYEDLRRKLVEGLFFDTLLHLGSRTFPEIGGEVVQNTAFTLWKTELDDFGTYMRLVDYPKSELKRLRVLEGIHDESANWKHCVNQTSFKQIQGYPICYWLSEAFIGSFKKYSLLDDLAFIDGKNVTGNNDKHLRLHWELEQTKHFQKYIPDAKGGVYRKWAGNTTHFVDWSDAAKEEYRSTSSGRLIKSNLWFQKGLTFSRMANIVNCRLIDERGTFDGTTVSFFLKKHNEAVLLWIQKAFFNSVVGNAFIKALNPTLVFQFIDIKKIPIAIDSEVNLEFVDECNKVSMLDWNIREASVDFDGSDLLRVGGTDFEECFDGMKQYWTIRFISLHRNEEALNRAFIDIYGLHGELNAEVPLEDITILQDELDRKDLAGQNKLLTRDPKSGTVSGYDKVVLPFNEQEIMAQFISYAVGCMFGRYSLDKEGLVLANQGETLENYLKKVGKKQEAVAFLPDDDNIIPVLDDEWFEDDIVGRFHEFLKATFGKPNFEKNLAFVEECLGKDIRKYFVKDFYADHIKRYSKRPIYWLFSSPKGAFNVLVYMHRYTPDTLNRVLNNYLKEYREKLNTRTEHLDHLIETGSASQQTKAAKEKDKLKAVLLELQEYERDVLYPMATERIAIDLDDGVLVNYNKFGKAIKEVAGLNDKKTKAKVKQFDWIDTATIR